MAQFTRAGRALALAVVGLPALLAGCASMPDDEFYSLSAGAATAVPPAQGGAPLYFEMRPVTVPASVRRPQLVVNGAQGQVELLEHHRWAGPLADEIGASLSLGIAAQLGAVDVYRSAAPDGAALYRIGANIQRFESAPGSHALVDAVWTVRRLDGGQVLTCRSVFQEPVGSGNAALVGGHRAALTKLAAAISAGVRTETAGGAPSCPAGATGA